MRQFPSVKSTAAYIDFNGGLDLVTAINKKPRGCLRTCSNVEIGVNGGYARIEGYERFDGRAKPSDAVYSILTCTISGVSLGDVLTDDGATAYGTVIALPTGQAILTLVTGTFAVGNVKVGGVTKGTCSAAQVVGGATGATDATYKNLAADVYRALIGVVPGSGSILGVHIYNDIVYAIRNNAGGTAAVLHKQSTSGWTAVTMSREVAFTSGGTTEIVAGNTITGATSAATAVVGRVVLTSGTWGAGTAAGYFYLNSQTGTFQAENLNVGASPNLATIAGNSSTITLTAGGRYEFVNANFGGATGTYRMYGASGVHKAFEFDGTTFAFVTTGMTADTPTYVIAHKNQLFLSFGPSAQHSSPGNPFNWSVVVGTAGEIACGDDITGFATVPGSETGAALLMKTNDRTLVLYGNGTNDWVLVPYSDEAGGKARTLQTMGSPVCLDSQGLVMLATTQDFGNFQSSVISDSIRPALKDIIPNAIASCIVREKNQYRIFFTGGGAFYLTFKGRKLLGITQIDMTDAVTCITSGEGSGGTEEIYFGSSDGYVYQMDTGTSFDGDPIPWNMALGYDNLNAPRQLKSFTFCSPIIEGEGYCEVNFSYTVGYGSTEFATPDDQEIVAALSSGVFWDDFTWDSFTWDGVGVEPSMADVTGTAENISLFFGGSSDEFLTFTISGAMLHYKPRREMRTGG